MFMFGFLVTPVNMTWFCILTDCGAEHVRHHTARPQVLVTEDGRTLMLQGNVNRVRVKGGKDRRERKEKGKLNRVEHAGGRGKGREGEGEWNGTGKEKIVKILAIFMINCLTLSSTPTLIPA